MDGGTGDTLTLGAGDNAVTVSNTETVLGGFGNDTVDLDAAATSTTVDLGFGNDALNLADGGNVVTVSNTESVTGGAGDDTVTVSGTQGALVDGGAGNDTLTGGEYLETTIVAPADGLADDIFGAGISISGDAFIVGAPLDDTGANTNQGAAYVYRFNGTTWVEEAKLTADDGADSDIFGKSVSISGNVALAGANSHDVNGIDDGAVYVYRFNGSTWTQEARLTASDGGAGDRFGISVSVSDNIAIVGAHSDDLTAGSDAGSAYIYRYNGTTWVEDQKLTASDAAASDGFGESVSISGNVAIVSSKGDDHAGGNFDGAVYVYRFDGTSWGEEAKLIANDAVADMGFGQQVSISGDVAVVGALSPDGTVSSAYVFRYDGTNWAQEAKLFGSDSVSGDSFGSKVSISGNTIVVGATLDDTGAGSDSGSAYVFKFDGTSWVEVNKLTASDSTTADHFGSAVAIDGDQIAIGADMDATAQSGGAYVFENLSGDDQLIGGAGDDVLIGGAGNDVLDGGADVDTADFSIAAAAVTVDLAAGTASDGHGGADTLANVENVTGSVYDDALTGDGADNVLVGAAGDDMLAGGGGNDVLDGGAGLRHRFLRRRHWCGDGVAGHQRATGGRRRRRQRLTCQHQRPFRLGLRRHAFGRRRRRYAPGPRR